MNLKPIITATGKVLKKNAPSILIGVGIGGMATATIMAVKATPKAERALAHGTYGEEEPTFKEKFKILAPIYAPSALVGLAGAGLIIAGNKVHLHRRGMVLAAYELSEAALKEWQAKTAEHVEENVLEDIKQSVAEGITEKEPNIVPKPPEDGYTNRHLCVDSCSGTRFWASIDELEQAKNSVNEIINNTGEACLNDFFDFVSADHCDLGNAVVWRSQWNGGKGLISSITKRYVTQPNGEPLLRLEYFPSPEYDFRQY